MPHRPPRNRTRSRVVALEYFEPRTLLTSYYISPTGSDSAAGTSASTAWKTIAKANTIDLNAGDQLLFQGGATFTAPSPSATNQISDSGFESGNLNSWTKPFDTAANATVNTTTTHVKSGTKSLRIGGTGASGRGQYVTSKVAANKSYVLKLWAKLVAGTGSAQGGITFRSGGNVVANSSFRIYGGSFAQYTAAIVAPPSFDSADVWVTKADGTSILYVDDFTLNETYATLVFDSTDSGTAANPVTIGSYGTGKATLNAGDGFGLWARDVSGFAIQNLNFVGAWDGLAATGTNGASGVAISNRQNGDTKLSYIRIDNIDASKFKWAGISISGDNGKSGYTDVRITNSAGHDNGDVGIRVEGTFSATSTTWSHSNIYVGYSKAYNNGGLPNKNSNSGNGILIGDTNGATIERNVAWNNGQNCNHTSGGPVGIWAWDSNAIVIQYNESYANKTGSISLDGGGFDLDGGVTNSVMQYNYSHDNYGAGYLLYQFTGARAFGNNVVRYNISQNDARYGHYAGIYMGGGTGVTNTNVYNNTIYITPTSDTSIAAIKFTGVGTNNRFRNNIFVTTGGVRLLESNSAYSTSSVLFQGNNWFSSGGTFALKWGGTTYADLATWRNTSQEKNGTTATGKSVNPNFVSAGGGQTFGDASLIHTLSAYQLLPTSTLINGGLNLSSFSTDPGTRDYFGGTSLSGANQDVGAFEFANSYTGSTGSDAFILRLGADGLVQLFVNSPTTSAPTLAFPKSVYTTYTINSGGGLDSMNLDLSNGNPLPTSGATFIGGSTPDNLIVTGTAAADTIAVSNSSVTPTGSGPALSYTGVGGLSVNTGAGNDTLRLTASGSAAAADLNLGTGNDTLAINAGTYTFNSDAALATPNLAVTVAAGAKAIFNATQHLGSLAISGSAAIAAGRNKVLVTKSLTIASGAKLDVNDNTVIVDHGGVSPLGDWNGSAYTGLTGLVASGRNGGAWNGAGISSTTAGVDPFRYTLGIGESSDILALFPGMTGTLAGETVDFSATVIRFTLAGDTNLDQVITSKDFSRSDDGWVSQTKAYAAGDIDYNGFIDADDLFYLWSNYNKTL